MKAQPHNLKTLAAQYGICSRTLAKWIKPFEKEIGKREGYYFTIAQIKIIFDKIGEPYC
ncbi:MAG TPA: hypothetical protein VNW99_11020 [Cytophagaceae bacterium]|jgi:hypothetical protein|nr:hypothetical protein [Cytophagaceae bacterium]